MNLKFESKILIEIVMSIKEVLENKIHLCRVFNFLRTASTFSVGQNSSRTKKKSFIQ